LPAAMSCQSGLVANRLDLPMTDENQEAWWRRTQALAVATLGGAAIVGLFLLVFSPLLDRLTPFSLPLGYFLVAEGLPLGLVLLLFWFANRQDETDRRHNLGEE
jgi:putative solute:sodium symporter small subunit